MPNRNDPGFSNEFAVQAGFPSSGEMQQRAGQGGLPPQRQQMPFEHKRAPATNQAVPYVQPVLQGTPAAQGSQYQVRQQQISPGVASFLRANAIDQGARGVEQRLGQIENQMQGMSSPRDAAVGSMAQMRAGRDTQQAPQRAPAAVSQAANMMQAAGPSGAGRAGLPPQMMPGLDLAALTGGMPVVPQQRVADVEQMRRGIAPSVAPIRPGMAPVGAQMPDVGMMNAMFPQGFVPTSIEDRRSMQRAPVAVADEPPIQAPTQFAPSPVDRRGVSVPEEQPLGSRGRGAQTEPGLGSGMEWDATPGDVREVSGDVRPPPSTEFPEEYEDYGSDLHGKSAGDIPYTAGSVATQMQDTVTRLRQLGDKVTKGILENAKQQVQKQKDYLHAALSEAGGGILAGGSPLLAQESITAVKALTDAQYQAAKAQVAIESTSANILANLLNQNNKVMLADKALGWAKDKEAKFNDRWRTAQDFKEKSWNEQFEWGKRVHQDNMDIKTEQGLKQWIVTANQIANMNGWKLDKEGTMELANLLGGDVDKEAAKAFWAKQEESGKDAPTSTVGDPTDSDIYHNESKEFTGALPKKEQLALDEKLAAQIFEEAENNVGELFSPVDEKKVINLLNNMSPAYRKYVVEKLKEWDDGSGWDNLVNAMDSEGSTIKDAWNKLMGMGGYGEMYGHVGMIV
jgi:hypothetical protein